MATLSSHTLNGGNGTHAGNIKVTLLNVDRDTVVFDSTTDSGGRLSEEIDLADFNATDQYQLVFYTGDYWREQQITHQQILDEVVLRFKMPDHQARYHMPLILAPNSYSFWASVAETPGS